MKKKFKKIDTAKLLYIGSLAIGIGTFLLLLWFGFLYLQGKRFSDTRASLREDETPSAECMARNLYNGVCVSEQKSPQRVYAVMIENHPDARPQSGLADAMIVYEAPVESNYSRFLAIFSEDQEINKIGPVRSARPYYLDWVAEYGDPLYAHVGGSDDALKLIQSRGVNDLNEFYNGQYYWRDTNRLAPHNAYTSTNLLHKALEKNEDQYVTMIQEPWSFLQYESCTGNCASTIVTTFLGETYQATWKYNTSTQAYDRYQMGRPHGDQSGQAIVAHTVIIQKVETKVLDAIGRISMETIGSGEALIFVKGHVVEGRWKKESLRGRTRWFDREGKEIALEPGKIWIEVVNQYGTVEYK